MPTPTRLANKTKWALEDILAECKAATPLWKEGMAIADARLDPKLMRVMARLRHHLSEIEVTTRLAMRGEYEQDLDDLGLD